VVHDDSFLLVMVLLWQGIHRLTIYLVEAMNRLKASVGLLASLSSEIAATQARVGDSAGLFFTFRGGKSWL
jgi:hypothetical protein